jgi:hypothetical protein
MAKFSLYAKEVLIGYSMLEQGDPPMGVVFGVFIPTDAYSQIQHECIINHIDQSALHLSVHTESGMSISCVGVCVLDYSTETGLPCAEVNVLGIPHPLFEELFPDHVARYDLQLCETLQQVIIDRGGA